MLLCFRFYQNFFFFVIVDKYQGFMFNELMFININNNLSFQINKKKTTHIKSDFYSNIFFLLKIRRFWNFFVASKLNHHESLSHLQRRFAVKHVSFDAILKLHLSLIQIRFKETSMSKGKKRNQGNDFHFSLFRPA